MYFQINLIQKFFVIQYQIFYPKDVYIYIYISMNIDSLKNSVPKYEKYNWRKEQSW